MKRWWIALLALVLAAGAGAAWWAQRRSLAWTSDSPQAVAQLEAALDASMKVYHSEAQEHLERALELDPGFAAAKVFLAQHARAAERERLVAELRQIEVRRLNRRERFLINDFLLRHDGDTDAADRALEEYLAAHPEDPFALATACSLAWDRQDFERARALYERLIAVDPNWVRARNNLGYIAMAQGRFEEAERQFETYAYIAPDQPNPHDSMAELLTLLGRYDDARAELEQALALRPNFCASYGHLLTVEILAGDMERAAEVPERADRHCDERSVEQLACRYLSWDAAVGTPPADVWTNIPERCRGPEVVGGSTAVRAALAGGESEIFEQHVDRLRSVITESGRAGRKELALEGLVEHYEGVATMARGRAREALRRFEAADGTLPYHGDDLGILKLANRADLARAQERLGDSAAATRTRESIAAVNPRFLEIGERIPLYGSWP